MDTIHWLPLSDKEIIASLQKENEKLKRKIYDLEMEVFGLKDRYEAEEDW